MGGERTPLRRAAIERRFPCLLDLLAAEFTGSIRSGQED